MLLPSLPLELRTWLPLVFRPLAEKGDIHSLEPRSQSLDDLMLAPSALGYDLSTSQHGLASTDDDGADVDEAPDVAALEHTQRLRVFVRFDLHLELGYVEPEPFRADGFEGDLQL